MVVLLYSWPFAKVLVTSNYPVWLCLHLLTLLPAWLSDVPQEVGEKKNIYSPKWWVFSWWCSSHGIPIPQKSPTIRQQKSKVLTPLFYVISIDSMHKILNHLSVLNISFDNWHYEPIIWNYPQPSNSHHQNYSIFSRGTPWLSFQYGWRHRSSSFLEGHLHRDARHCAGRLWRFFWWRENKKTQKTSPL